MELTTPRALFLSVFHFVAKDKGWFRRNFSFQLHSYVFMQQEKGIFDGNKWENTVNIELEKGNTLSTLNSEKRKGSNLFHNTFSHVTVLVNHGLQCYECIAISIWHPFLKRNKCSILHLKLFPTREFMDGMYLVLVFIVTIIRQSGNVGFVTVLTIVNYI